MTKSLIYFALIFMSTAVASGGRNPGLIGLDTSKMTKTQKKNRKTRFNQGQKKLEGNNIVALNQSSSPFNNIGALNQSSINEALPFNGISQAISAVYNLGGANPGDSGLYSGASVNRSSARLSNPSRFSSQQASVRDQSLSSSDFMDKVLNDQGPERSNGLPSVRSSSIRSSNLFKYGYPSPLRLSSGYSKNTGTGISQNQRLSSLQSRSSDFLGSAERRYLNALEPSRKSSISRASTASIGAFPHISESRPASHQSAQNERYTSIDLKPEVDIIKNQVGELIRKDTNLNSLDLNSLNDIVNSMSLIKHQFHGVESSTTTKPIIFISNQFLTNGSDKNRLSSMQNDCGKMCIKAKHRQKIEAFAINPVKQSCYCLTYDSNSRPLVQKAFALFRDAMATYFNRGHSNRWQQGRSLQTRAGNQMRRLGNQGNKILNWGRGFVKGGKRALYQGRR